MQGVHCGNMIWFSVTVLTSYHLYFFHGNWHKYFSYTVLTTFTPQIKEVTCSPTPGLHTKCTSGQQLCRHWCQNQLWDWLMWFVCSTCHENQSGKEHFIVFATVWVEKCCAGVRTSAIACLPSIFTRFWICGCTPLLIMWNYRVTTADLPVSRPLLNLFSFHKCTD